LGCDARCSRLTAKHFLLTVTFFIYQKEQKEKKGCKNRTTDIATARQSARCFFFLGDKRSVPFQSLALFRFLTS
jgi:hypothetical protein